RHTPPDPPRSPLPPTHPLPYTHTHTHTHLSVCLTCVRSCLPVQAPRLCSDTHTCIPLPVHTHTHTPDLLRQTHTCTQKATYKCIPKQTLSHTHSHTHTLTHSHTHTHTHTHGSLDLMGADFVVGTTIERLHR